MKPDEKLKLNGWKVDTRLLLKYNANRSKNLIESFDEKYGCLFYNIEEHRMSWYNALVGIYEDKQEPILISNLKGILVDYSSINPAIIDENMIFLRREAFNAVNPEFSGFPFIIINIKSKEFGFLDFNYSSLYYSLVAIGNNSYKLHLDSPKEIKNLKYTSRDGEVIDLATIKLYSLDQIDNLLELYWKEKASNIA